MEGCKPIQGKLSNHFFYKVNDSGKIEDRRKVFCSHCKQAFSYSGSVSSLQYHLRAKHSFAQLRNPESQGISVADCAPKEKSQHHQPKLSDLLQNIEVSNKKQNDLTNAFAHWIASSGRPINIVEDKGLKRVIQIALNSNTYKMPTRKNVTSRILNIYDVEKQKIQSKLACAESICLTGDFWTSVANDSYLGITAHWIDNSWTYQSTVLQVKGVKERHTADQCCNEFLEVATEWKILDKVAAICTDNARNMTLGVKQSKFNSILCAAHTLQLSLNKALEVASISNLLAMCRKIVGHFKRSPAKKNELEIQQTRFGEISTVLQQDVPTRWNSTYFMIASLVEHKEAITETLKLQNLGVRAPTSAEWEKLVALKRTLKPCLDITQLLGGEKYVSASAVLPVAFYLKAQMVVTDDDSGFIARLKAMIINDLQERIENWPCIKKYEICTALDPRFKSLNCLPSEKRNEVWENVIHVGKELNVKLEGQPEVSLEFQSKRRKLSFDTQPNVSASASTQHLLQVEKELNIYRGMEELNDDYANPLDWWKLHSAQLPLLAQLAKRLLCFTATSVPVERVFSSAGFVVNKFRSTLDPKNVNVLVCLRSWLNDDDMGH